jgi:ParB family chromosome partitioning protein
MPDFQNLRSSIQEVGLIQPVLLREKRDGYQIVCGFRRVSIMEELGSLEIESRVFGEKEMDELRLFSISLHENLTSRGFNAVEKAIALNKLVHRFQVEPSTVIKTYLPLFSLEPNEKILNTYLSLAQIEDEVKRYVLKEEVSRSNIRKLSILSSEDRIALLSLISCLKLSENRLKEVLTLLEEISRRDQCTFREIVHRPEIRAILSQKGLTPSQRTERVKEVLMDFRYPRMHQLEEEFERKRKNLHLPPLLSIRHQPFFEGKGLNIEFHFESMEEYRDILSSLSRLADKKEFEEIIKDD